MRRRRCLRLTEPEVLEPRRLLAADPLIAEFQAINQTTILDEDGDSSDWIEVRNPGTEAIDLGGWYLTDEATDLTKWRFPSTRLGPGEQLLVFASGKDRHDGAQLHTNFRLSGDGEFLALVRPDGITVAQDFGSQYPPQEADRSYGLAQARQSTVLIDDTAGVRTLVPTDDSLGLDWTQPAYDDAGWVAGVQGVGFEKLTPAFTQREEFDGPLGPGWTVDLPAGAQSTIEVSEGALKFSVPAGQDTSSIQRGLAPLAYRDLPPHTATEWEFVARIQKETPGARGAVGIMIFDGATGTPAIMFEQAVRQTFRLISGGSSVEWTLRQEGSFWMRLSRDEIQKTWTAAARPEGADDWTTFATITDGQIDGPVVADPKPALYARTPTATINAQFTSAELNFAEQRAAYSPRIGLDVAQQMSAVNGSLYLRFPFQIAGDPARFDVLSLGARYDDGFRAFLNGVEIAARNVPVGAAWNATASASHGAVQQRIPFEQLDLPAALPQLRSGENVFAVQAMNVAADDADFFFQGSLVASEVLTLEARTFTTPTPGAPNLPAAAPAPQLIGNDGVFFGAATIQLRLEPGAAQSLQIHYTLDGSLPTLDAPLYSGPITITESAMLHARTFDTLPVPNYEPSTVTAKSFIALSEGLRSLTSNMPLMVIDTLGQGIPESTSTDLRPVNLIVWDVNRATSEATLSDGLVEYLGRGGVRRRGASTATQPKPQLALETWGPSGTQRDDDFDASLLGMPADSDWVLHAPYGGDPAFFRNRLAYELSNQLGCWAPHTRFVEVYLNDIDGVVGQEDYVGVYVLTEKIKQGPDRLDVADITRDDNQEPGITGGYIWKVDRADPAAPPFVAGGQSLNWVYPDSPLSLNAAPDQRATEQQQQWVVQYWDAFRQTLVEPKISDSSGYARYIDVDAWVDQHLVHVVMYNADALGLSSYFHKDRNGKIAAGPVWDFNLSAESRDQRDDDPRVWREGAAFFTAGWWSDLFRDPGFWQRYVDRWQMWRASVLTDDNLTSLIQGFAAEVGPAADRNAQRWPTTVPREASGFNSGYLDGTYQGEVEHLREWMMARLEFLDGLFTHPPELLIDGAALGHVPGVHLGADERVELASASLAVPDDIRLVSGVPGESQARYLVPANNELADTWTQIDFDDSSWMQGSLGLGFDDNGTLTDLIGTPVDPRAVQPGATNILARIPFQIDDFAQVDVRDLVLRMKFEDGYVAYLNGVKIASDNLREGAVGWDASANNRTIDDARVAQELNLSRFKHLLVPGTNVLAVRGLNSAAGSAEMLLLPELVLHSNRFERSPAAKVYYTLDGSDPRGPDGRASATAREAIPGQPLQIEANTRVIARSLDPTDRGFQAQIVLTDWSGPVQYDLVVSSAPLQITEINYNPAAPTPEELLAIPDGNADGVPDWNNEDFEFIELYNPAATPADLVGVRLSGGADFDFATSATRVLPPGGYGLVVKNRAAFELRYGGGQLVLGEYDGQLGNGGQRVELTDGTGTVLFSVTYGDNDPWPVRADGVGATLEWRGGAAAGALQGKHYSWRGSIDLHGSPGAVGRAPLGVVINEVLANTDGNRPSDSIELYNPTNAPIDIGGWYLSDSAEDLLKYRIPDGVTLGPDQYRVFDESQFNPRPDNPGPRDFALNGVRGDDVWLTAADAQGRVAAMIDDVHFRGSSPGQSLTRFPNGAGRLVPASQPTLGAENRDPQAGRLVISELNYNPGPPADAALAVDATLESGDLEFVEVLNPTTNAISLRNWRLRGGVDYDFDDDVAVEPNQSLIVLSFDPRDPRNARRLSAVGAHYGIDLSVDAVAVVGGYAGGLNNSADLVALLRPEPIGVDQPDLVTHVLEDEVLYDDLPPWPVTADGTGSSLQRRSFDMLGNDPTSWLADIPTPGEQTGGPTGDFDGNRVVDLVDLNSLLTQLRSPRPDLRFDLSGDEVVDADDRDLMVRDILGTSYGDANLDGVFNSTDLLEILQRNEYEDGQSSNSSWEEGDWNGDGEFTTADMVLAFQQGGFAPGE